MKHRRRRFQCAPGPSGRNSYHLSDFAERSRLHGSTRPKPMWFYLGDFTAETPPLPEKGQAHAEVRRSGQIFRIYGPFGLGRLIPHVLYRKLVSFRPLAMASGFLATYFDEFWSHSWQGNVAWQEQMARLGGEPWLFDARKRHAVDESHSTCWG